MNRFEWLADLCLLEISFINNYVVHKSAYPMRNTGRTHHGLLYTVKGQETYFFKDMSITAFENSILYIPKGEQYRIEFDGEISEVITLDFEIVGDSHRPFIIKYTDENFLFNYFFDAEKKWKRMDPGYKIICKSFFYKIIHDMIKNEYTYANSKQYKIIAPSVEYLKKHYTDSDFKIETLYKISNLSPKYYEILFKKYFHISPKEYAMSLKIKLAKNLLLNEKTTVGNIALMLGYKDMYNFSKTFKQKTGYSPSEYKKIYLKYHQ